MIFLFIFQIKDFDYVNFILIFVITFEYFTNKAQVDYSTVFFYFVFIYYINIIKKTT